MKLYAYNPDTMEVLATATGETNEECESKMAAAGYPGDDEIGWTYSPAFGTVDGLVDTADAEEIE